MGWPQYMYWQFVSSVRSAGCPPRRQADLTLAIFEPGSGEATSLSCSPCELSVNSAASKSVRHTVLFTFAFCRISSQNSLGAADRNVDRACIWQSPFFFHSQPYSQIMFLLLLTTCSKFQTSIRFSNYNHHYKFFALLICLPGPRGWKKLKFIRVYFSFREQNFPVRKLLPRAVNDLNHTVWTLRFLS